MTTARAAAGSSFEDRALASGGSSHGVIYRAVADALDAAGASGTLVDVGCGHGAMSALAGARFRRYVGVDGVRYPSFPAGHALIRADLDGGIPLADGAADAAIAVETIEHLENPRALVRELVRVTRPGGCIVISTPNQLSVMSLLTLLTRQRFAAFQDVHYPAHRTALLEVDLRRIAAEARLRDVRVTYATGGRMPFTARHYPAAVVRRAPRLFSDTVVLTARTPA